MSKEIYLKYTKENASWVMMSFKVNFFNLFANKMILCYAEGIYVHQ